MKTKTQKQQISKLRKVKELIKTGAFILMPVVLVIYVVINF